MRSYLFIFFIFSCLITRGQNEKKSFFKEIACNINRSNLSGNNIENKFGFGLGIYGWSDNILKSKFLLGIEYNRTAQFHKTEFDGKLSQLTNVNYLIHNFSIPIGVKYYFDKNKKTYLNIGGFGDLVVSYTRKGISHISYYQNGQLYTKESEIKETEKSPGIIYGLFLGIGKVIQVNNMMITISLDYKIGLNSINTNTSYTEIYNRYARFLIAIPINKTYK